MLRIIPNMSADRARSYYSHADYLAEGQESVGTWRGQAAEKLGLSGTIQKADFEAMCDNLHPQTGGPLTLRTNTRRTIGYDFNFHVPKSVSLLYELKRDQGIFDAFRAAVRETMSEVEREASTRVRKEKADDLRQTSNLVWGEFFHFTSRPVGGEPDPHLHAHCFAFNATHDDTENAWKAAFFGAIKRDSPYFEAYFHSSFARRLADLGYPIERTKTGWEIQGLTKSTLDKFSRRTKQIEALAKEKGIDDPDIKAELGAKSREKKNSSLTMTELRDRWQDRLDPRELDALNGMNRSSVIPSDPDAATRSLEFATDHHFERHSVVAERTLLATAMKAGIGKYRPQDLFPVVAKSKLIVRNVEGRNLATTTEVLAEEDRLIAFARDGRDEFSLLGPSNPVISREWLNSDQKNAISRILHSTDRVTLLRGSAGVGKTTLMTEAIEQIESTGQKVFTFAPSADASRGTLRKEGFITADTVARLLVDKNLQAETKGQILWIDEAGLMGSREMAKVFDLAAQNGNRVVLSGDVKQHGSVSRGACLRILETQAGLIPARVKEIQRQKGKYKAAVAAFADGRIEDGFAQLDALGWIEEVSDEERVQRLANEYVETLASGKSAMAISPTHKEGEELSSAIRSELRKAGLLDATDHQVYQLTDTNLTEAERGDSLNYAPGMVVQFHQNTKGHKAGERLVLSPDKPVALGHPDRLQLFTQGSLTLAAGDVIRITKGGKTLDGHRLDNGSLYKLKEFTPTGDLRLENNWVIAKDYGHLAQGYVSTSHSSQGKTVDRVFVSQSSRTFPAGSKEQFYVSCSRAREKVMILTDSKETLKEAVFQSDPRLAATELVRLDRPMLRRSPHLKRQQRQRQLEPLPIPQPRKQRGLDYDR